MSEDRTHTLLSLVSAHLTVADAALQVVMGDDPITPELRQQLREGYARMNAALAIVDIQRIDVKNKDQAFAIAEMKRDTKNAIINGSYFKVLDMHMEEGGPYQSAAGGVVVKRRKIETTRKLVLTLRVD